MLLVLLVWSWNSQSKYYQITKINTLKLTGHASHKDLSTIQINRRGHVYFSLPPSALEQRRADARLCVFYKVIHGLVAVPLLDYINHSNTCRISRYCHSMTFRQVSTSTDCYKFSFFPLAIVQWNSLPESVACLQSLDAFKAAVCKLQHSRP